MNRTSANDPNPGHEDEVFGGINLLSKSLRDLDERGLVLSLAAFAEDALGDLIRAFLIPSDATSQMLAGFNAPLGTLSSRTKAAFAMGLITSDQYEDLERLRKIRNEFAHAWRPVDLSQQKLATLVKAMNYSRLDNKFPESLAEKLRSAMSSILVEVRSCTHQLPLRRSHARLIGNHLVRGFPGEDFDRQFTEAQNELDEIRSHLSTAAGEKREFYRQLSARLAERLPLLTRPQTPEDRAKLLAFREQVQDLLR